ncbi:MAG TPA: hypothetical protein VGM26_14285 [Rhizomicrobium sp.]|jgi:hypothetical protein
MTAIAETVRPLTRPESRYFYFHMALACMAVAFIGFVPTYWVPLAAGSARIDPVLHLHGLIFFSWTLYYVFQTWLAATGQIARHRMTGLIGVSLATAMLIFGVMAAIHSIRGADAAGNGPLGGAFAIVPLTNITFFALLIMLALANVRRPEWHKRLMLMAAIFILGPAIARWFLTLLPAPRPPSVVYTLGLESAAYLLVLVPLAHDWRTRGRPHPVYITGAAARLAIVLLRVPFSGTHAWHSIAGWVSRLAGRANLATCRAIT